MSSSSQQSFLYIYKLFDAIAVSHVLNIVRVYFPQTRLNCFKSSFSLIPLKRGEQNCLENLFLKKEKSRRMECCLVKKKKGFSFVSNFKENKLCLSFKSILFPYVLTIYLLGVVNLYCLVLIISLILNSKLFNLFKIKKKLEYLPTTTDSRLFDSCLEYF